MEMCFMLRAKRRMVCGVVLALAMSGQVVAASPPAPISYAQAQQRAVAIAPTLIARQSQIDAGTEEAERAGALPDPRLLVGLANWPVSGPDAFSLRADEMTTQQIGLMQEFPARAKRRAEQALAQATLAQAKSLSRAEQQMVAQAAAQAWIELWSSQQAVAALQALREPAHVAERTARARLAGGTAGASDVLAAQAALLQLDNRLEQARAEQAAAQAGLARWLGLSPELVLASDAVPDFSTLPLSPEQLLSQLDQHAPLLGWEARQAVAQAKVDAAVADTRPDWSVELTYGRRERAPDGMRRSDMLMVEVGVGLPLFQKNRQARGIAARRAELEAVAAERDEARRVQAEAVQRALALWRGLTGQLERQRTQSLPLARDRAHTALAAYGAGAELQPWLEARRDEIELQLENARLMGEQGRAWAALAYLLPHEENTP
ncbi:TolC family protein [Pseudoxanthomonas sp. F37]|nr:TolC family protein [Pseudoxanthomonas mexicana]UOV07087.1 TolC family protein [Pseudoxanthomonas sp. F37]